MGSRRTWRSAALHGFQGGLKSSTTAPTMDRRCVGFEEAWPSVALGWVSVAGLLFSPVSGVSLQTTRAPPATGPHATVLMRPLLLGVFTHFLSGNNGGGQPQHQEAYPFFFFFFWFSERGICVAAILPFLSWIYHSTYCRHGLPYICTLRALTNSTLHFTLPSCSGVGSWLVDVGGWDTFSMDTLRCPAHYAPRTTHHHTHFTAGRLCRGTVLCLEQPAFGARARGTVRLPASHAWHLWVCGAMTLPRAATFCHGALCIETRVFGSRRGHSV